MILHKQVIKLNISLISFEAAINRIIEWGKRNNRGYVCFANAHMAVEAYQSELIMNDINNATLVLADGVPIQKSLSILYSIRQSRISGMDAFPELMKLAEKEQISVFFFGSTETVLNKLRTKSLSAFPSLKICGSLSPSFTKSLNDAKYIDYINQCQPNLVFVALGCPKQEMWMAKHYSKINAILLGVGGAFPVYAGITNRAPKFMQKNGLEWMYRLYQEPKRLFMRYFITNSMFIILLAKQWLSIKLKKQSQ